MELFFLDAREQALVSKILTLASAREQQLLEQYLSRLHSLALIVQASPRVERAEVTDALPAFHLELHMPARVRLGLAYLVEKISLLRALEVAVREQDPALANEAHEEFAQSVYSLMGEQALLSLFTDRTEELVVRERARSKLLTVWNDPLLVEVDDFAPSLEVAWRAREAVRPVLGALLGAHEMFRLFRQAPAAKFLEYFGEDEVPEEQLLAFEEFLFGLCHESIERLREHLRVKGDKTVSLEQARSVLAPAREAELLGREGPEWIYVSFRERKLRADMRTMLGTPGPRRTAEEYVVAAQLRRGAGL